MVAPGNRTEKLTLHRYLMLRVDVSSTAILLSVYHCIQVYSKKLVSTTPSLQYPCSATSYSMSANRRGNGLARSAFISVDNDKKVSVSYLES